jgi:hypothetical protein
MKIIKREEAVEKIIEHELQDWVKNFRKKISPALRI